MISVDEALSALFDLVSPLPVETVSLRDAHNRVLAQNVTAKRDQPPFSASSMDGYAIRSDEAERHAILKVVGESAAGHRFEGVLKPGQAVRIFTGAPVPEGADFVVIQEDVTRKGDLITLTAEHLTKNNIRAKATDFAAGTTVKAPLRLGPAEIALLAGMNIGQVPVTRAPKVALVSTGDELVMPGETPSEDQIIVSNTFGLRAMLLAMGVEVQMMPIGRDTPEALHSVLRMAQGADLIVTIGGASVGDHDLVGKVAAEMGLDQSFYKVAMRPGKPLMAGRIGDAMMIGLPGNPVSAMVCGHVFLAPVIRAMQGLPAVAAERVMMPLSAPMGANGPREHYMRGVAAGGLVAPLDRQDSSLLSVFAQSNALIVRPIDDPARNVDDLVPVILL
jgi:molybdopterin molybdotransferase